MPLLGPDVKKVSADPDSSPAPDANTYDVDVAAEAEKIQNTLNLHDLNGEKFWYCWVDAGGDPDEYVKETMPNFGIVGALLLTITIPLSMEPVGFAYGDARAPSVDHWSVIAYAIALNVSTATSMAQIIISVGLFQQYVNCYSKELRVGFAAKLGYVVGILTSMLIIDTVTLFIALFIALAHTYNIITSIISIAIVVVGCAFALAFYTYIVRWNSQTYSKQMVVDNEKKKAEQAEKEKADKYSSANNRDGGELKESARELQAALAKFASNLDKHQ